MMLLPLFFLILAACGGTTSAVPVSNGEYLARYEVGGYKAAMKSVVAAGGTVVQHIEGVRVLVVRSRANKFGTLLASDANIMHIEDNVRRTFDSSTNSCTNPDPLNPWNLPLGTKQMTPYGIALVQGNLVQMNPKNPKKICLIDTGLDIKHPDICGQADNCAKRITNTPTTGYNFSSPDWYLNEFEMDPLVDEFGHGTRVAGIIAAIDNASGVASVAGGSTRLHIVKVGSTKGSIGVSAVLLALSACINSLADVINMSFSGPSPSVIEEQVLQEAFDNQNVLHVASAGNFPNTTQYPAAYPSVLSVGAIGSDKVVWSGSTTNEQVDLVAPGDLVLSTSTYPRGAKCEVKVGKLTIPCAINDGSRIFTAAGGLTANLVDCRSGNSTCPGARGRICLVAKGASVPFDVPLTIAQNNGCVGLIFSKGIRVWGAYIADATIPSGMISDCDHQKLRLLVAAAKRSNKTIRAVLINPDTPAERGYEAYSGTSYAAPHVSAVAALIWSYAPSYAEYFGGGFTSPAQIREALINTAMDLGTPGYDTTYGNGLVQAKAALDYLVKQGWSKV